MGKAKILVWRPVAFLSLGPPPPPPTAPTVAPRTHGRWCVHRGTLAWTTLWLRVVLGVLPVLWLCTDLGSTPQCALRHGWAEMGTAIRLSQPRAQVRFMGSLSVGNPHAMVLCNHCLR